MTKRLYFFFIIGHLLSTFAAADHYDIQEARRLADVHVYDVFHLDSTNAEEIKKAGTFVFLYRELGRCLPNEECRRLAVAWRRADGTFFEIPIAESEFQSVSREFDGSISRGAIIKTTARVQLETSGPNGFILMVAPKTQAANSMPSSIRFTRWNNQNPAAPPTHAAMVRKELKTETSYFPVAASGISNGPANPAIAWIESQMPCFLTLTPAPRPIMNPGSPGLGQRIYGYTQRPLIP